MDGDIFVTVEILAYQSDYAVFLTKRNETKTIRTVKNGLELLLIPIIPAVGLVAIYLLVLVIIAVIFRILEKIKKCFKQEMEISTAQKERILIKVPVFSILLFHDSNLK